MNKLSQTFMTIAVAGTLLFGGVAASSAELAKAIGTERQQINGVGNLVYDPLGGDGLPIPNTACSHKGQIIKLKPTNNDQYLVIQEAPGEKMVEFYLSGSDQTSAPMLWDTLKESWLRNLVVHILSVDGPCTLRFSHQYQGDYYDGGKIKQAVVSAPTE